MSVVSFSLLRLSKKALDNVTKHLKYIKIIGLTTLSKKTSRLFRLNYKEARIFIDITETINISIRDPSKHITRKLLNDGVANLHDYRYMGPTWTAEWVLKHFGIRDWMVLVKQLTGQEEIEKLCFRKNHQNYSIDEFKKFFEGFKVSCLSIIDPSFNSHGLIPCFSPEKVMHLTIEKASN
ncbi:F-box domain-containing protein [Caenorhabditis elegans]|uniref:F-box domain-containing protein n=1 Tax=Caenorhabditis elegans TaxID=6239 RepID=Q9N4U4_CAEEL|nr:F-box domain-containing protein [Caenorhabditis elegans]CCD64714.2 F-box domain-containing protein [Caenorhabditis elegans]|eukprot:NP_494560.2 F-box B protein [Caenorhabditis elegans]